MIKKMYIKPETDVIAVEMMTVLCGSKTVGFGTGAGSGKALAPRYSQNNSIF